MELRKFWYWMKKNKYIETKDNNIIGMCKDDYTEAEEMLVGYYIKYCLEKNIWISISNSLQDIDVIINNLKQEIRKYEED